MCQPTIYLCVKNGTNNVYFSSNQVKNFPYNGYYVMLVTMDEVTDGQMDTTRI